MNSTKSINIKSKSWKGKTDNQNMSILLGYCAETNKTIIWFIVILYLSFSVHKIVKRKFYFESCLYIFVCSYLHHNILFYTC